MRWIALFVLFMCSCATWSPVTPTGDERENWVLSETSRFSGELGVKVRGQLTDSVYSPAPGQIAAGWYQAGVAYYYRPWIVKQNLDTLTNVAAHEVCHSLFFFHDAAHWDCSEKLASATYPFPGGH